MNALFQIFIRYKDYCYTVYSVTCLTSKVSHDLFMSILSPTTLCKLRIELCGVNCCSVLLKTSIVSINWSRAQSLESMSVTLV